MLKIGKKIEIFSKFQPFNRALINIQFDRYFARYFQCRKKIERTASHKLKKNILDL